MIYTIEARPIGFSDLSWKGGGHRFSHKKRAEFYCGTIQHHLNIFCPIAMETRVVENEGDLLAEARPWAT